MKLCLILYFDFYVQKENVTGQFLLFINIKAFGTLGAFESQGTLCYGFIEEKVHKYP